MNKRVFSRSKIKGIPNDRDASTIDRSRDREARLKETIRLNEKHEAKLAPASAAAKAPDVTKVEAKGAPEPPKSVEEPKKSQTTEPANVAQELSGKSPKAAPKTAGKAPRAITRTLYVPLVADTIARIEKLAQLTATDYEVAEKAVLKKTRSEVVDRLKQGNLAGVGGAAQPVLDGKVTADRTVQMSTTLPADFGEQARAYIVDPLELQSDAKICAAFMTAIIGDVLKKFNA